MNGKPRGVIVAAEAIIKEETKQNNTQKEEKSSRDISAELECMYMMRGEEDWNKNVPRDEKEPSDSPVRRLLWQSER